MSQSRRDFLKAAGVAGSAAAVHASIGRALAIPAKRTTGTIRDVRHIVILMQENRSFDHYFGTMKGVRGFGDRHPIPLPGGKSVWAQSNGARELPPFHLDTATTNALKVPGTPHSFADAQAAWNQGKFGLWPKFKTDYSMGYYRREDIPFQFALAEAFTICDAYCCSVMEPTWPNRLYLMSGPVDPGATPGGPLINNTSRVPYRWRTYPEAPTAAAVKLKCCLPTKGCWTPSSAPWRWKPRCRQRWKPERGCRCIFSLCIL